MAYTTQALVEAYLQTSFNSGTNPTATTIATWITWAEAEIDRRTSQKWETNTESDLIIDLDRFNTAAIPDNIYNAAYYNPRQDTCVFGVQRVQLHPKFGPILSASTISRNMGGETEADSWEALTEQSGSGGDFILNLNEATIDFLQNNPRAGKRALKISALNYGRTSVPAEVQKLATMLVSREVLDSSFFTSQNGNWDSVSVADISLSKANNTPSIKSIEHALERQWLIVGQMFSQVV